MKAPWLKTMAVAAIASLSLAACSDSESDSASPSGTTDDNSTLDAGTFEAGSSLKAIQDEGKLVVGVKFDQPGFGQKNPTTNDVEGFDVDIAVLLAQGIFGGTKDEAALKIEYVESVSKNREPFIQDGRVDMVVATYTINDTRKAVVDFAGPYYVAHGDIMVKSDDDSIKEIGDLNGKNVCTARGSTYPKSIAEQAPQATITELDTYSQCAEALGDGRVQAVSTDNVILAGLVQGSSGAYKLVNTNFTDEPYGIGVKKGDTVFVDYINDRLTTIYDDGEWKAAYENTLGKLGLETPEPPAVDRYLDAN